MRLVLAAAALAFLAASAAAKGLSDPEGDGNGADIVSVVGILDETAHVQVLFAAAPELGSAIRGVLVYGEPGSDGPAEWYQFTMANETHVFAAHGTPREVRVIAATWNGTLASLEFERSEPATASCSIAVVESGVFGAGGFEVRDVAPRGFASMDAAWPVDACPMDDVLEAGEGSTESDKESPGLGLGLFAAVCLALLLRRR